MVHGPQVFVIMKCKNRECLGSGESGDSRPILGTKDWCIPDWVEVNQELKRKGVILFLPWQDSVEYLLKSTLNATTRFTLTVLHSGCFITHRWEAATLVPKWLDGVLGRACSASQSQTTTV